mmetsp:Transcript_43857/g.95475  ORF Transcript_43857/g.95475 Transcript_43857/m.95475 type:complete len:259 (-) Transcript_43857:284-1060(-)
MLLCRDVEYDLLEWIQGRSIRGASGQHGQAASADPAMAGRLNCQLQLKLHLCGSASEANLFALSVELPDVIDGATLTLANADAVPHMSAENCTKDLVLDLLIVREVWNCAARPRGMFPANFPVILRKAIIFQCRLHFCDHWQGHHARDLASAGCYHIAANWSRDAMANVFRRALGGPLLAVRPGRALDAKPQPRKGDDTSIRHTIRPEAIPLLEKVSTSKGNAATSPGLLYDVGLIQLPEGGRHVHPGHTSVDDEAWV